MDINSSVRKCRALEQNVNNSASEKESAIRELLIYLRDDEGMRELYVRNTPLRNVISLRLRDILGMSFDRDTHILCYRVAGVIHGHDRITPSRTY